MTGQPLALRFATTCAATPLGGPLAAGFVPRGADRGAMVRCLRMLRMDDRAFCRNLTLRGGRTLAETAGAVLDLEADPYWPIALRAAVLFAGARAVGDGAGWPWGPHLVRAAAATRPQDPSGHPSLDVLVAELAAGRRLAVVPAGPAGARGPGATGEPVSAERLASESEAPRFEVRAEPAAEDPSLPLRLRIRTIRRDESTTNRH